jgi:hypothetical protein
MEFDKIRRLKNLGAFDVDNGYWKSTRSFTSILQFVCTLNLDAQCSSQIYL